MKTSVWTKKPLVNPRCKTIIVQMSDKNQPPKKQLQHIAGCDFSALEGQGDSSSELFRATLDLRWVRLPAPGGRCEWSGLSRTSINALILPSRENKFRPPVLSASLRKPGQRKAARLINLASLLSYLREQTTNASGVEKNAGKATKKGKNT